jgi:hypothetical protein
MKEATVPPDRSPIACSLDRDAGQQRQARWQALADRGLLAHGRTAHGARQRYRADPEVERELRELIELEGDCCAFLDFELERADDALVLDVRGPREADAVIELFAGGGASGR